MARVEIYTRDLLRLLRPGQAAARGQGRRLSRNIDITWTRRSARRCSSAPHGRTTVPQIFIDDRHVGGCDDLHALDRDGRLDPMLTGE